MNKGNSRGGVERRPKRKKKPTAQVPSFYTFRQAALCDQPLARQMLRDDPAWLAATNSLGETALHDLVIEDHQKAVRFLLELGAEVDSRDAFQATPLIHAAQLGYHNMAALLMEHGADIHARDDEEETALFKAASGGYGEICELLLNAGADGQARNSIEQTVLEVALPRKQAQIAKILEKRG